MKYEELSAKCYVTDDGVVRHKFARHSMPAGRPVASSTKPTGHMVLSLSSGGKVCGVSYARACWMLYWAADIPDGLEIDHVDRNPQNNMRENLRLADRSEQLCNQRRPSTTGATGVYQKKDGRFDVQVWKNGRAYWGGKFNTLEAAIARRAELASTLHGEFAT